MSTVLPLWLMILQVTSDTAIAVIGWFGLSILDVSSDWIAYYAAGHFVLERQIANIYDFNSLQACQAPLIGDYGLVLRGAPRYKPLRLCHAVAGACLGDAIYHHLRSIIVGIANFISAAFALP